MKIDICAFFHRFLVFSVILNRVCTIHSSPSFGIIDWFGASLCQRFFGKSLSEFLWQKGSKKCHYFEIDLFSSGITQSWAISHFVDYQPLMILWCQKRVVNGRKTCVFSLQKQPFYAIKAALWGGQSYAFTRWKHSFGKIMPPKWAFQRFVRAVSELDGVASKAVLEWIKFDKSALCSTCEANRAICNGVAHAHGEQTERDESGSTFSSYCLQVSILKLIFTAWTFRIVAYS